MKQHKLMVTWESDTAIEEGATPLNPGWPQGYVEYMNQVRFAAAELVDELIDTNRNNLEIAISTDYTEREK